MSRRELRERIFKLLFRIEFNSMEEMETQTEFFFLGGREPGGCGGYRLHFRKVCKDSG